MIVVGEGFEFESVVVWVVEKYCCLFVWFIVKVDCWCYVEGDVCVFDVLG